MAQPTNGDINVADLLTSARALRDRVQADNKLLTGYRERVEAIYQESESGSELEESADSERDNVDDAINNLESIEAELDDLIHNLAYFDGSFFSSHETEIDELHSANPSKGE